MGAIRSTKEATYEMEEKCNARSKASVIEPNRLFGHSPRRSCETGNRLTALAAAHEPQTRGEVCNENRTTVMVDFVGVANPGGHLASNVRSGGRTTTYGSAIQTGGPRHVWRSGELRQSGLGTWRSAPDEPAWSDGRLGGHVGSNLFRLPIL